MNPRFQSPPPAGPESDASTVEVAAPEAELLRQELAEQRDLNLRLTADFENFKRRSRQEAEGRAAAQKESFMHDLLPVLDNLQRAMGAGASSGFPQFHKGVEMTAELLDGHEAVIRQLRVDVEKCAKRFGDAGTADFLTGLMEQHEKMAWMLRSTLEKEN